MPDRQRHRPSRPGACTCAALLFGLCVLALPRDASAQIGKSYGAGGGIAFYYPVDDDAHDSVGFALTYRLGRLEGWRPTFGFNWFDTEFDTTVAGERVPLGTLHVRPVMGGYAYGRRFGRVSAIAGAIGGYAFNSFDVDDQARIAYDRRLDTLLLRVTAANGLAARAEVGAWIDVTSRIGILTSAGFVVARPEIDVITEFGRESMRLKADSVKLQVGVVYGIF